MAAALDQKPDMSGDKPLLSEIYANAEKARKEFDLWSLRYTSALREAWGRIDGDTIEFKKDQLRQFYWSDWNLSLLELSLMFDEPVSEIASLAGPMPVEVECVSCGHKLTMSASNREEREAIEWCEVRCERCTFRLRQGQRMAQAMDVKAHRDEARIAELKSMPYDEYLLTPEWKAKRLLVLERDGNACRVCSATERLDVHHRRYENRGNEPLEDLTTLCRVCHETFHEHRQLARPTSS